MTAMLKLLLSKTILLRASMKEEDQPQMTVSLKVDQDTKMGIVTDIKEALRKAYALKINYSAQPRQ